MATNLIHDKGARVVAAATDPATPASGDPVRLGKLTGVALVDEGDGGNAATDTTIDVAQRVWKLNVDDNEATGIAPGDKIYYHDTPTGSPATSLNNTATAADAFFGIALGTIATNGTSEIEVLHLTACDGV